MNLSIILIAALAVTPLERPEDAVSYALGDLVANVPVHHQRYIRYLHIDPQAAQNEAIIPVLLFAIHAACSQDNEPDNPAIVAGGRLLRLDAKEIDSSNPERFLRIFDSLAAQDGTFHSLANLFVTEYERLPVGAPIEINFSDGSWNDAVFRGVDEQGRIGFSVRGGPVRRTIKQYVRPSVVHAGHLGRATLEQLVTSTHSQCPILDARFFVVKALSTVDGGKYYDFRQVPRGKGGQSDLDALFASLGVNRKFIDAFQSDARAGVSWSNVTGMPRSVILFPTLGTRVTRGSGMLRVTLDVAKGSTKENQDPTVSLIEPDFDASEVIWTLPNGFNGFALYNAAGQLQDEVPPNIAHDTTVPAFIDGRATAESRLFPGKSCIVCHGPFDGFQQYDNVVLKKINRGFPVLSDKALKAKGLTPDEAYERLKGLYGVEHDLPRQRARDDYAGSVFRLTGMEVDEVAEALGTVWSNYLLAPVSPRMALVDVGYQVPEGSEEYALSVLVGELKGVYGERLESQKVADLLIGESLQRSIWERNRNEVTLRVREWEEDTWERLNEKNPQDETKRREILAVELERILDQAKRRGEW